MLRFSILHFGGLDKDRNAWVGKTQAKPSTSLRAQSRIISRLIISQAQPRTDPSLIMCIGGYQTGTDTYASVLGKRCSADVCLSVTAARETGWETRLRREQERGGKGLLPLLLAAQRNISDCIPHT